MQLIRPFRGIRVVAAAAARVSAPPYDVMNTEEARAMAAGNPDSFLHVSRPEIDLGPDADPYSAEAYAQARRAFERLLNLGLLRRDAVPAYYLYRLTMGRHRQLGIAAEVAVAAYEDGRVKKHEFTRPAKEDDRMRHIEALDANTGPVFLLYRHDADLAARLDAWTTAHPAEVDFTADDGVRHELWPVTAADVCAAITATIDAQGALYIADGHHRAAAAARVSAARRAAAPAAGDDAPHHAFFGVLFPDDQVQVLDYNRVVRDLNGLDMETLLRRLSSHFSVIPADGQVRPDRPGVFGMYVGGAWYRLSVNPEFVPDDPVGRLDASILSALVLEPILGIADIRRDDRIDFVGGIRGLDELERRVDSGEMAVAFSLHPVQLHDLMAVADAGAVMPPKSTWFEPKLRDGLVLQSLLP